MAGTLWGLAIWVFGCDDFSHHRGLVLEELWAIAGADAAAHQGADDGRDHTPPAAAPRAGFGGRTGRRRQAARAAMWGRPSTAAAAPG